MRIYRLAWWATGILLAFLGTISAVAVWSFVTALIIFGCVALLTTSAVMSLALPEEARSSDLRTSAATVLLVAVAAVALCGVGAILGPIALSIPALLAAGSPPAVAFCLRRLQTDGRNGASPVDEPAGAADERVGAVTAAQAGAEPSPAQEAEPETMDDATLCKAWRTSYWSLRDASPPSERAQIVAVRERYLDELERRHPAAVSRWLQAETGPCGDPGKYLAAEHELSAHYSHGLDDAQSGPDLPTDGKEDMAGEAEEFLVRLQDTDLMVAEDEADVRGRKVIDRDGQEIGEIDGLLIDAEQQKVRFLQVSAGGFLGIGERRFLVPVDAVTSVEDDQVTLGQDREHVAGAPVYDPDLEDKPDRGFYEGIYGHYGYAPYWEPGYRYPRFP
ncbi:PRC-barrel domain-containing protein [Kribbella deserti]|uniref:PRC-barrel domain-containing protein n=1 Tax=Kribbella deserti TaxID=1926257 RepID=A0ABV6QI50_9ACTN